MAIAIKHTDTRSGSKNSAFSDQQIRQIVDSDSAAIAQWARTIAKDRGISVRSRPNDRFVKAVSLLSDGVIDLDPVEELLIALGRAGVISAFQRGLLQIRYLR